jgi:[protein-PII] uridylyltransferase
LFRAFFENALAEQERPLTPAITWEDFSELGHSAVCFCTWNRHDLLAKIAGSFSVVPLNILSADIFPREDHTVLAIFRVCNVKEHAVNDVKERALVENTLQRALEAETFEFAPQLEQARRKIHYRRLHELEFPTAIAIDNKAHPVYTLIQIETPDRIGLLYDLLTALGREGTDIVLSRISTQKGAAVDTFYLTDSATGAKITDSNRIAGLQHRLRAAILSGAAR